MKALNSMEDETSTKSILDKFIVKLSLSTDDKKARALHEEMPRFEPCLFLF